MGLPRPAVGSGIAQLLLRAVVREMKAQGYVRATLWVLSANERARRCYQRNGWAAEGARKMVTLRGNDLEAVRYAIALRD